MGEFSKTLAQRNRLLQTGASPAEQEAWDERFASIAARIHVARNSYCRQLAVALGEAANLWFRHKMKTEAEQLRAFFAETAKVARDEFSEHEQQTQRLGPRLAELRQQLESGELSQEQFDRELASL